MLPQGVKAAIGRRLDHVSETTTDVLRTAAILGKTFERTFGDWTDKDWERFDRAWRSFAE